ncbi:peroxiredoxin [Aeromicrobium sp.]|nr:peroxiredoxin [Candidatus Saccharibacteria bacterium]
MIATAAPDFELLDQDGTLRRLADYRGHWLVIYFYPNDRSINCTREACHFRDEQKILVQFGNAAVVGINKASVAAHKKFSDRNYLNFPILSDPGHVVTEAYHAWRSNSAPWYDLAFGTRRNTYIINPQGLIVKEYLGVAARNHVETVIRDLQELQAAEPTTV